MADKLDKIIEILQKSRDDAEAARKSAADAKSAREDTRTAKSAQDARDAAQKAVELKEKELELLRQEEGRLRKIGEYAFGKKNAYEGSLEKQERLNDLKEAELQLERAQAEARLAGMDRTDPDYEEAAKKVRDLDKDLQSLNNTRKHQANIMASNVADYKQAIQFVGEATLVYGKHEFANTSMLLSFRNLGKALATPQALLELTRATITGLINTMFAFTLQIDTQTHAIMRQTGASKDNAAAMMENAQSLAYYGVQSKDIAEAVGTLRSEFKDFTFLAVQSQNEIKNTAVLLEQLGVSFSDSSRAMQNAAVSMGRMGESAAAITRDLADFATIIDEVPSELISNFASAGDSLAKFGYDGVSSFKELAIRSKVTTLEIEKMLRMVEKFDTFEGAATQAGKLNAALGGNFVNAMDLMMTTNPAERFDMIRDAILNTGLTFDDMSYYQRKFFTEAAGLESVADLAKIMRGDFSDMGGDIMKSSDEFEKLAERTKNVQDIQEKFKTLLMSMIPVFEPLILNLQELLNSMSDDEFKAAAKSIMESVSAIAEVLIVVIPHIDTLVYAMAGLGAGRALFGPKTGLLGMLFRFKNVLTGGGGGGLTASIGSMNTNIATWWKTAASASGPTQNLAGNIAGVGEQVSNLADTTGPASQGMESLSGTMNRTGPAAQGAGSGLIQLGVAAVLMGAGIGLAAYGVSFLVKAFSGLGDAAWPAVAGILAFGVALALFVVSMKFLLPVIAAGSATIYIFAAAVGALAISFAIIAASVGYMASSLGDMFKQLGTEQLANFKEVMGYFATGTGGVSAGIRTVTENIDVLVTSLNAISTDSIRALGDAMTAVSTAASANTSALKADMEAIMGVVTEANLPKIEATTALIGAVKEGSAATASAVRTPFPGAGGSSFGSEKVNLKVYIGDTELKDVIRATVNGRLAELGVTD